MTQMTAMLDSMKESNEDHNLKQIARHYVRGRKGALNHYRKQKRAKAERMAVDAEKEKEIEREKSLREAEIEKEAQRMGT